MLEQHVSWANALPLCVLLYTVYIFTGAIYRVFFHPLAAFPGPKLAALTTYYQAWYDIWHVGQWFKHLEHLHRQYGPIVRINPHELHIADPEFIDVLYTNASQRREKYKWIGRSILLPESISATVEHTLHRQRRAALNPLFSKEKVRRLEGSIQQVITNLMARLEQAAARSGQVNMSLAYKATASDIITNYAFGTSTDYLLADDFNASFFHAVDENFKMAWYMTYIWWLGPVLAAIPPSIMGYVHPGLQSLWTMRERWASQIEEIRASKDSTDTTSTIFHGLLNGNLSDADKTTERLRQEAQLLVLAGQDTTAQTLTAITYQLLANPSILHKLKVELHEAFPDSNSITLATAERLSYLRAVVQEGLRLHPGALTRQTRVSPTQALVYENQNDDTSWEIPPGNPVTMTAYNIQMNPSIFPNPHAFLPERWLDNPRLDRYLLAFSKGTRNCLGMHLAYAEIYLVIATVFRRFELFDGRSEKEGAGLSMALFETVRERDIDAVRDFIVPYPAEGSEGLRVTVRS